MKPSAHPGDTIKFTRTFWLRDDRKSTVKIKAGEKGKLMFWQGSWGFVEYRGWKGWAKYFNFEPVPGIKIRNIPGIR